jgi:hypothetical protein
MEAEYAPPWFKMMFLQNNLKATVLFEDDSELKLELGKNLFRALQEVNKCRNEFNVMNLELSLVRILKNFLENTFHNNYYTVGHFRKDASGLCVDILPALMLGNKAYRFCMYFQPEPDNPISYIAYARTTMTPKDGEDDDDGKKTVWTSRNYSVDNSVADFVQQMSTWSYRDVTNYHVAAQVAYRFLIENTMFYTFLDPALPQWHYVIP